MESRRKAELEKLLRRVNELHATLESVLDQSLTNPYVDANRYIKQYNQYRNETFSLVSDEYIAEILPEMPLYVYSGDDAIDVKNVKQQLVDVYLKTSQLVAYLQNQLEFN
ncbi:MAG TPA: hypothetical protein VEG65_05130 [Candidatus Bathyarchaeia archaeon]|nr:hypothetical protein [Candidatus Bathyarchaeia archaeon]